MEQMLHLYVLASGSKGNAAVVEGPEGSVLIDCGLSLKELRFRAASVGCELGRVQAVLVTHEHSDHVSGLTVLSHNFDVPFISTTGTVSGRRYLQSIPFVLVDHDCCIEVAGMTIQAFPTSHDVADPMGFRFEVRGEASDTADGEVLDAIGWMTDTGYVTDEALEALRGVRVLGIESNHDVQMLRRGPYPIYLKRRILSERGHLSNDQAAEALASLVSEDTETVVALHLSEENNLPTIAVLRLARALGAIPTNATATEARTPDGRVTVCAAAQSRAIMIW